LVPRKRVWLALAAIAALVAAMIASGTMAVPAQAHCSEKNQTMTKDNDRFRNFDYAGTSDGDCNIDWPVDFLFWDDAGKTKVKNKMEHLGYDDDGSVMHGKLDDSSGWAWDADKGRKNLSASDCLWGEMEHYRLYAVYSDNSMYNVDWGNYVLGTAHIDNHECNVVNKWSGDSETAEDRIKNDIRDGGTGDGLGCVDADRISMDNYMDISTASDGHVKHNSGRATSVCVR
jgi:hypothetical protein